MAILWCYRDFPPTIKKARRIFHSVRLRKSGKRDRPVSFVQCTLLALRILHVTAAQMFSEELVDKAHVIHLTPCESQIIQHLWISAEYVDAADVKLLALIHIDFKKA